MKKFVKKTKKLLPGDMICYRNLSKDVIEIVISVEAFKPINIDHAFLLITIPSGKIFIDPQEELIYYSGNDKMWEFGDSYDEDEEVFMYDQYDGPYQINMSTLECEYYEKVSKKQKT